MSDLARSMFAPRTSDGAIYLYWITESSDHVDVGWGNLWWLDGELPAAFRAGPLRADYRGFPFAGWSAALTPAPNPSGDGWVWRLCPCFFWKEDNGRTVIASPIYLPQVRDSGAVREVALPVPIAQLRAACPWPFAQTDGVCAPVPWGRLDLKTGRMKKKEVADVG